MKPDIGFSIRDLAPQERPREKMIQSGPAALSNAELLAILIRTGTRELSALDLANRILALSDEGLQHLGSCTTEDLAVVSGIGPSKACQILAGVELGKRLARARLMNPRVLNHPREVAAFLVEDMKDLRQEWFRILLLNNRKQVLGYETVSVGTLNASLVHPRDVFEKAIRRNAASILLVHNHPSGNPRPSEEDRSLTGRLVQAGALMGIEVVDHVIVGNGNYYSFKEQQCL